jgi:hypothetical protein
MPLSLNFGVSHRYASADSIEIPIELRVVGARVELIAIWLA